MEINKEIKKILSEVENLLSLLTEDEINQFIQKILSSKRIFVAGAGRSGIIAKAFAMRLMQLGLTTYVVGETITPPIKENDLLIIVSGSGKTQYSQNILKIAGEKGAYTYLLTGRKTSPMGKLAHRKILLPAPTKFSSGKIKSEQVAGSLFEQGAFIFLECIVNLILKKLKMQSKDIMLRHTNLE